MRARYHGSKCVLKLFRTRLLKPVNARKHSPDLVYHPKCKIIKEIYFLSLSGMALDSAGETEVDGGEAG